MVKRPDSIDESDREAIEHAKAELEAAKHRAWLWQLIKRGAVWVVGIVGGLTMAADGAAKLWKLFREHIL